MRTILGAGCVVLAAFSAGAADANRLVYLDESDPYYVSRTFPKLTTPQWVGEPGVDAVVVLSIDDMREPDKYEAYLRPILDRLKAIDGRAPVSIMTNTVDPAHPHYRAWLDEGVSIDAHTMDHPCPLLEKRGFDWASANVHDGVDLLHAIPGNDPVAFRMPCCDSLNTPSPRFYAEIFNKTSAGGHHLTIDSSIFCLLTPNDPDVPRHLTVDPDGRERFRKYVPFPSFANTIEDYPYPYVIGGLCWEFPCIVPSDWEGQNINGVNSPKTVEDMKAALDAVVEKQGVYTLVFHPHGWIENTQVVELIDHAVATHGKRVKFLTFREAAERLNTHLLGGHPLRAADGSDNGVRLLDVNADGYIDVLTGNDVTQTMRIYDPQDQSWHESPVPFQFVRDGKAAGTRLAVNADGSGRMMVFDASEAGRAAYVYEADRWTPAPEMVLPERLGGHPLYAAYDGVDQGLRFRDVNNDGRCELLVANAQTRAAMIWDDGWTPLPLDIPEEAKFVDAQGRDNGLRFVDIDEDGNEDLVFSNESVFGLYLYGDGGWTREIAAGPRQDPVADAVPPITWEGTNYGAWFHGRTLWVQNEYTSEMPDLVARRPFNDWLEGISPAPKPPEVALDTLRVRPGYRVELVAAEPLVADPVAFDWSPDGRLFVVEMRDYPTGLDGNGAPGSRVKVLHDDDGDGQYDRAAVFLDDLAFATGVTVHGNGIIVTCAPEILYAEDTNGDDRADRIDTLYTGFGEGNQQHRVNGLRWGLDGWWYGANGDSHGVVGSPESGQRINLRGRDFRIHPATGAIETVSGQTQFGRDRDDWGHWFGCANWMPVWHYALDDTYTRRNPHYAPPDPRVFMFDDLSNFPISPMQARFNDLDHVARFTSTCGLTLYRDTLLGEALYGDAFVCEPVHNLVFRAKPVLDGATYTGSRAPGEEDREFLASTDNWFRPVMARTGPDGALWIADMYRGTIEHPEYISELDQARTDFRAGDDMGRIYRVVPVHEGARPVPWLSGAGPLELVETLAHPNGVVRDIAHRLLLEHDTPPVRDAVRKLARDDTQPRAQVHALHILATWDALTPADLGVALQGSHPGILRNAIQLAEPLLVQAPELAEAIAGIGPDAHPFVVQQAAYTLGEWDDTGAGTALGQILAAYGDDPYIAAAVMSSTGPVQLAGAAPALLEHVRGLDDSADIRNVLTMILRVAQAADDSDVVDAAVRAIAAPEDNQYADWHLAAAAVALEAAPDAMAGRVEQGTFDGVFAHAAAVASDPGAPVGSRTRAAALLGHRAGRDAAARDALLAGIDAREPLDVVNAALRGLGRVDDSVAVSAIFDRWDAYTAAVRGAVLAAALSKSSWTEALLARIESGAIPARQIDAVQRQQLLTHRDETVRTRAAKLLSDTVNPDRQALIKAFEKARELPGDPARGRPVFQELCAKCHQVGDMGHDVGPDLAAMGDRSFDTLLTAILDPNRAVETRYLTYTADTVDWESHTGVLANETDTSITLKAAEGVTTTLLRSDVERITVGDLSMMPEGLEEGLEPGDMADLIAFVQASGLARKSFEGNAPAPVRADADGALHLTAQNAEIYGETLAYEPDYQNLGNWASENDHAVWRVEVPAAGLYTVRFNYCCDNTTAGNTYRLQIGDNTLSARVRGTGTWDRYWAVHAGEVRLPAGPVMATLQADGEIEGTLIELREIVLVPVSGEEARS